MLIFLPGPRYSLLGKLEEHFLRANLTRATIGVGG